ncbi:unnamed protein product [Pedinophyceae sp. YPF-701]|nr:unnamed protein product [Pedinophyceae sp. YPF-701]
MTKIIDIMKAREEKGEQYFSFEFFPPKTPEGVTNLFERMKRMVKLQPTFCDITWGAGGSTADLTLDIARRMQQEVGVECMMHLTCTNMEKSKVDEALAKCKEYGITNILALRGDPPAGQERWTAVEGGFTCALDLVKYIREQYGDYFGIAVAGYPEAHPDAIVEDPEEMKKNYQADIEYLKKKLEAGADFVVTQLFYETGQFVQWVKDCRAAGITAPIVPGIMPIMAYGGFRRMTGFCKTKIPKDIDEKMESLKEDDAGVKQFGMELGSKMVKEILDSGAANGVHMYTLNLEKSAVGILERVGLVKQPVAA